MTTCPGFESWETMNELCQAAHNVATTAVWELPLTRFFLFLEPNGGGQPVTRILDNARLAAKGPK